MSWANSTKQKFKSLQPRIVALDGKGLKGVPWKIDLNKLYTLNAWDTQEGCFIGQVTIGEKTNEITAAPKLLNQIDLEGTIVTTDALLTQKEIASGPVAS